MKKALSVFLMAAMAFGAFADEPAADVKVAEFSGNAKVEWGVNLDSGKTGFKNSTEVNLKLNLLNDGTKSTTGDGVWGELVIKTDADPIQWKQNAFSDAKFEANNGMSGTRDLKKEVEEDIGVNEFLDTGVGTHFLNKVYVDTAKIHFGPAYVGIKNGNTEVGQLKLDTAVRSNQEWLSNEGANKTDGIVVGFDSDIVKVDVDVRSLPAATQYTNDYGMAAEVEFKAVENLSVKGGVSYEFKEKGALAYAGSAGYKLALDDTFFVRPQVGVTGTDAKDSVELAAGVLFGWGEMSQDKNTGVYFLGDDYKKVSPGVSVAAYIPLKDNGVIRIEPSFFSGELVPNLTAAAWANIAIQENTDTKASVIGAVKYAIAVDALTITPQAGVVFANKAAGENLKAKVGVDVAGLIDNTTLSAVWESGNLSEDDPVLGTFNVGAKIAL